ncbi:MAG: hypothetical protein OD817_08830, partial [Gammaproteobacteria bacterium]
DRLILVDNQRHRRRASPHANPRTFRQPAFAQKQRKASRAIAALADFAAIVVKNAHQKLAVSAAAGALRHQDLVATHPAVPVGEPLCDLGIDFYFPRHAVK